MSVLSTSNLGSAASNLLSGLSGSSGSSSSGTSAVSSTGSINVNGLVSGLNTSSIIQGLLAVEQQKITDISNQEAAIQSQQSAFQAIRTKLQALQSAMSGLSSSQTSAFDGLTATSSDTATLTAAASSNAAPGVYSFRVAALAQADEIASQGFDSANSAIPQGTLQISVGTKQTATVTIGPANATVQGLADAINAANIDVSAAVVNDGSSSQGARILLTSRDTGLAGKISIVNNLAPSSGGSVRPVFDANAFSTAIAGSSNVSTSAATASGAYSGSSNDTYSFKVVSGGTVGTDNGIQLSYSNASGTQTGTITLNASDAGVAKSVANGLQIQFGAGTLATGDSFQVKAFVPTVQAAQDAQVTLGAGAGALTVSNSTNVVNDIVPGLTLNLLAANPGKSVTVTIAANVSAAQTDIGNFVSAYNDVVSLISTDTQYDSTSRSGGPLLGNASALTLDNQIRNAVSNAIAGANPLLSSLASLGVTSGSDGTLAVDSTKLSNVLNGAVSGIKFADVKRLFALTGTTSSAYLQFVTASTQTKAIGVPYQVHVTQAASAGSIVGGNALAASTVIDGTNDSLNLAIDGRSASLTLAHGTYTPTQLAAMLQATINSTSAFQGRTAAVSVQGSNLSIASNTISSSSVVALAGGTAAAALGYAGNETGKGRDVAGYFVVNGQIETASGSGQFLVGSRINANTADLQVRVTANAAQVGSALDATVTPSRGVASQMDTLLTSLFDPVNGILKNVDEGFTSRLSALDSEKTTQNQVIQAKQAALQEQFTAMEQTLATLQNAAGYINALAQANSTTQSSNKTR